MQRGQVKVAKITRDSKTSNLAIKCKKRQGEKLNYTVTTASSRNRKENRKYLGNQAKDKLLEAIGKANILDQLMEVHREL